MDPLLWVTTWCGTPGTSREFVRVFFAAYVRMHMAPARLRKEKTYPELCGEGGRARLVVLAAEVGGRWSAETAQFITAPASARAESEPSTLKGRMAAAWTRRWSAMLACSAGRAFALCLLDRRSVSGTGGPLCTRGVARRQVLVVQ